MRRHSLVLAGLAAAVLVVGCVMYDGPAQTSRLPLASPSSPAAVATAPVKVPSPAPASAVPVPSGAPVTFDPELMSVLPANVGGTPVTEEASSFAEALHDPGFVSSVDRAAFAIAASGLDLASGVVAHLRPGIYSDKMFTDWRASYDEGACGQASGAVGHAESSLGGRTIYTTTCGGGLRVYHAYLPGRGAVVSLFSVGPRDFGSQLMAALRD